MSERKKKVGAPERKLTMEELEDYMDDRGVPHLPNTGTVASGLIGLLEEYEDGKANDLASTRKGLFSLASSPEALLVMYAKSTVNPNSGQPWKNSAEVLSKTIDEYFLFCATHRITPTVAGVCSWLGIGTDVLKYWKENQNLQDKYVILKRAVDYIHALTEGGAVEGTVSSHVLRYLGTNYWAMKDTADIEVSLKNPLEEMEKTAILEAIPDVNLNLEKNLRDVTPKKERSTDILDPDLL